MWNYAFPNRRCNEYDKIRVNQCFFYLKEHKLHLERVVTVKPKVDLKEPALPSFLMPKNKKEKVSTSKILLLDLEPQLI